MSILTTLPKETKYEITKIVVSFGGNIPPFVYNPDTRLVVTQDEKQEVFNDMIEIYEREGLYPESVSLVWVVI